MLSNVNLDNMVIKYQDNVKHVIQLVLVVQQEILLHVRAVMMDIYWRELHVLQDV